MTAPVAWPVYLPQQPASYSEQDKDIVVRTQPDSGPTKGRLRFTKAGTLGQMEFLFTIAQREAMRYFYETQLKRGSVQMIFTHPWTLQSTIMTISQPPKYTSDGPLGVRCTFPVEFFAAAADSPTAGQVVVTAVQNMPVVTQQGLLSTTDSIHATANQTVLAPTMSAQGRAFVRTSAAQSVQQLIQTATLAVNAMTLGANLGSFGNSNGTSPFKNLMFQAGQFERIVGSGEFTEDQGLITATVSTDEFRALIIDIGLVGSLAGRNGTYVLLNPSGMNVGVGPFSTSPLTLDYSTSPSREFEYTGGFFCVYCKGSLTNAGGNVAIVKVSEQVAYAAGNIWSSEFQTFQAGLGAKVWRFMDWASASNNVEETWAQRAHPGKPTLYAPQGGGIPWEFTIDAANRFNIDPWLSLPVRATDDYITKLGQMLNNGTNAVATPGVTGTLGGSGLNVGRKAHIEIGNECWNEVYPWSFNHRWFCYSLLTKFATTINPSVSNRNVNWPSHGCVAGDWVAGFGDASYRIQGINDVQFVGANQPIYQALGGIAQQIETVVDPNTVTLKYGGSSTPIEWPTGTWHSGGRTIGSFGAKFVKIPSTPPHYDNAVQNSNFALRCKEVWDILQTQMGGLTRLKRVLGSWAAVSSYTDQRMAATGVASSVDAVAIAPYFNGENMMLALDHVSGTVVNPRFFCTRGGTVHINIMPNGSSQPTEEELEQHTAPGLVSGHTWTYTREAGIYTRGTDETGLVSGATYIGFVSYRNDGAIDTAASTKYLWTFSFTFTAGATKAGTSTTSLTISSGTSGAQNLTTQAGKSFAAAQKVHVYRTSDPTAYMSGTVTSYDSGTGALVFELNHKGSTFGTFTDWTVCTREFFYDSFTAQMKRNRNNSILTGLRYINNHVTSINASSNPAADLVLYESGNHMSADGETTEMAAWIETYLESSEFAQAMDHNVRTYASENKLKEQNWFSDVNQSVWAMADNYFDTADLRFQKYGSFAGFVPRSVRVSVSDQTPPNILAEPSYPYTVATLTSGLTYEIMSGDKKGNYAFVGNELRMVNSTGVNWATSGQPVSLACRATDGLTDCLFTVGFTIGPLPWYGDAAIVAHDTTTDITVATMNPEVGNSVNTVAAASSASGGLWIGNASTKYSNDNGTPYATPGLDSTKPYALAFAFNKGSAPASGIFFPIQVGAYPLFRLEYDTASGTMAWRWAGPGPLPDFSSPSLPVDTTTRVYWVRYDPVTLKFDAGHNQTDVTASGGDTIPAAITGASNLENVKNIPDALAINFGPHVLMNKTGLTKAEVKAVVQAIQTKLGI
jgi:hypothetical protein